MTSNEIRQSFLDFFKSKQHAIVSSSSLLPDAPNLLFTNAGMNQFVPIFLGETSCPFSPGRAADAQKCIRAGGKLNDLEDVGLDTYHHTFFEMLGNWSFGDYFKREAIDWAWELVTGIWRFPKDRLYATIYSPDRSKGDPAERDEEAYGYWREKFVAAGLDPDVHIVNGGKADNFWTMGETGPCGPCSELHVDLTPKGDTRGALVNRGKPDCMEIWNLVFIQFNANPDGTYSPLPSRHVDTGMGLERVAGILQQTRGFTDFSRTISNYETDGFRPLFAELERLSGRRYESTLPAAGGSGGTEQEKLDVAFRVIADHIRTLSFAIADGIRPGNVGRKYVLRRILRRAVRYGRTLGFHEPFFHKLVSVLVATMGEAYPELAAKRGEVEAAIRGEEEAFNKTLDTGLEIFQAIVAAQNTWRERARRLQEDMESHQWTPAAMSDAKARAQIPPTVPTEKFVSAYPAGFSESITTMIDAKEPSAMKRACESILNQSRLLSGDAAFKLYDTHGFPADLTDLLAREAGFSVDHARFEALMQDQKSRSAESQKRTVISVSNIDASQVTRFVGFDELKAGAEVLDLVTSERGMGVILDTSPCYAQMGGQVGDTGRLSDGESEWKIVDTQKAGNAFVHLLGGGEAPEKGARVHVTVDAGRRASIQRHHTVTHLLHWALHEVVSREATQQGSQVAPDKLTFDFNGSALSPGQLQDLERLVNERILENAPVAWTEVDHARVQGRKDIMQFFADKYGDRVRVVQIGGRPGALDGYSMELCGGTHTRSTGEIGLFRVTSEAAIAAGIRRIEASAGMWAYDRMRGEAELLRKLADMVNAPVNELDKKFGQLIDHQRELEKRLKAAQQAQANETARGLVQRATKAGEILLVAENLGNVDGDFLQAVADALKGMFDGVSVLGGSSPGNVALVATVPLGLTSRVQAGSIIKAIAPIVSGRGGGRPENARGGGKDDTKLDEALAKVAGVIAP